MSDASVPLLACFSLASGALGVLAGTALAWCLLRRRTDADADADADAGDASRTAPLADLLQPLAAALRSDMEQLAQQQARQVDAQVEHLHRWQRDLMQFLDDRHRRQMAEWRLLLQPKGAVTKPLPAPPPPAEAPPMASRELTDEEIDALPPELPQPVARKRLAQAPTKPVMRNL